MVFCLMDEKPGTDSICGIPEPQSAPLLGYFSWGLWRAWVTSIYQPLPGTSSFVVLPDYNEFVTRASHSS